LSLEDICEEKGKGTERGIEGKSRCDAKLETKVRKGRKLANFRSRSANPRSIRVLGTRVSDVVGAGKIPDERERMSSFFCSSSLRRSPPHAKPTRA